MNELYSPIEAIWIGEERNWGYRAGSTVKEWACDAIIIEEQVPPGQTAILWFVIWKDGKVISRVNERFVSVVEYGQPSDT